MPPRTTRLAFAVALVASAVTLPAQEATSRAPFLTGACSGDVGAMNLDSLVSEPEQRPSLLSVVSVPAPRGLMRANGDEAKVVVAFVVDTNGAIRPGTAAVMSSTDSTLSRWACDAVPQLRFIAAREHGRAVATQLVLPFVVRVPPSDSALIAASLPDYLESQVQKPVTTARIVHPQYPQELRDAHVEGHLDVRFVVDTTGHADMATFRVVRATEPRFIDAARESVARTLYHPAEIAGRKVRQVVDQPFDFWLMPGSALRTPPPPGRPLQWHAP